MRLAAYAAILLALTISPIRAQDAQEHEIRIPESQLEALSEEQRQSIEDIYRGNCIINFLGFCSAPRLVPTQGAELPSQVSAIGEAASPDQARSIAQGFLCEVTCSATAAARAAACAELEGAETILVCLVGAAQDRDQCVTECTAD